MTEPEAMTLSLPSPQEWTTEVSEEAAAPSEETMQETPAQAPRSEEEAAVDEAKRKTAEQGKGGAANTINIDLNSPVARVLGMEEIAEGVATTEQAAHLRELGCRFAQGYLFSKPLPAEAVGTLLTAEASKGHSSPER